MRGNPGNLRRAAAAKSAAAQARAGDGLEQMLRRGDPITFRGLAQTAGVSLDFLYRTGEIRSRVEQLRARQQAAPPPPAQAPGPDQPGSVIRTLTAQLAELNSLTPDNQALERTAPVLPMMPGVPKRRSFDYVRHGTIDLFAALNIATGKVIGKLSAQHRAVDFRDFLDQIDRQTDAGLDVHVICDLCRPGDYADTRCR
jgi:hypothetical protein